MVYFEAIESSCQTFHIFDFFQYFKSKSRSWIQFTFHVIFSWRWNHTPFDEATSNGHKDVADLLLEGIRYWEDDEERKIKEEFDSNDDEFVTNDNSITSDAEPTPCEISNIISNLQFSVGNVYIIIIKNW